MATKVQKRQNFIRHYRERTGKKEVDMHEVAIAAQKMGWPLPTPVDPLDLLARQFADAAREETRRDKETKQPYKAQLAITRRSPDGRQLAFWFDVDEDPPRHKMSKGLKQYRDQMVCEAIIGSNTADHWNRIHPDQLPLPFVTDLTEDVNERRSIPIEEEAAS